MNLRSKRSGGTAICVAAWVWTIATLGALAQSEMVFFDFDGEGSAWRGTTLVTEPVHGGQRAMRWDVAKRPALDSPRSWADWSDFDELRFWAYSEKNWDRKTPIIFAGEGGYYITYWRVDWTGWKHHRIRLKDCASAHSPVGWHKISHVGFRASGYGLSDVPDGFSLVFDDFTLHSSKDIPYTSAAEWRLEEKKEYMRKLKERGNPYFQAILEQLKSRKAKPTFKKSFDSCWTYASEANQALLSAWAAASDDSTLKGDKTQIAYAVAMVDWLLENQKEGTWFFSRKWEAGDPNTDRFTLGPLADAVWYLRTLPGMDENWRRWEKPLKSCVDFQHRNWSNADKIDPDKLKAWGKAATIYPNQDVFILHIMELAHRWWGDEGYKKSVDETLAGLRRQLLPDGAFRYIGPETECHTYHNLNLVWLARYLNLTDDPRARSLIVDSVGYYPSAMSNEAVPEYYTDCWWKHYWGDGAPTGPEIVAGLTGDAQNKWLANRLLERVGPGNGYQAIYAGMFYRGDVEEAPLRDNYVEIDPNIDGPRGRFGNFYFAGTVGGGARDTFAGCMTTDPSRAAPLYGALMAANIEAEEGGSGKRFRHCYYISGPDDITATKVVGDVGVLGARYTLRKPYINSVFDREVPPTDWQGTQVWLFTRHGLVGLVEIEALKAMSIMALRGELRFGPKEPLERVDKGVYQCGGLLCRVLDHNFDSMKVNPARGVYVFDPKGEMALNFRTRGSNYKAQPGRPLHYAAAVGPKDAPAAQGFRRLGGGGKVGLAVTIDGKAYEVTFDPDTKKIDLKVGK